jgi:hypothetical protein
MESKKVLKRGTYLYKELGREVEDGVRKKSYFFLLETLEHDTSCLII